MSDSMERKTAGEIDGRTPGRVTSITERKKDVSPLVLAAVHKAGLPWDERAIQATATEIAEKNIQLFSTGTKQTDIAEIYRRHLGQKEAA